MRRFLGPSAGSVVLLVDRPRSAVFDAEEAIVGVGFAVGAAHGFEFLRTDSRAALEGEGRQTALHRYDEHVLAAVLLSHEALVRVQFVVRAADVAGGFGFTVCFTVGSGGTVLEGNRNDSEATGFLLQFAT